MTATPYTYSVVDDFPNQKVNSGSLTQTINESAIQTALSYLNVNPPDSEGNCVIWFVDALSSGDKDILDAIVASHQGNPPLPGPEDAWNQDGAASLSDESSKAVIYSTAYQIETLTVLLTPTANVNWWVSDVTKTGFTINLSASITGNVYWEAKGY